MRTFVAIALAFAVSSGAASAQEVITPEAKASLEKAVADAGCKLSTGDVEVNPTFYELDADCADGKKVLQFDKTFKAMPAPTPK